MSLNLLTWLYQVLVVVSLYAVLNYFSCVWLFATPCTVAYQAPVFMGFSRQEYWSGLPSPSPGDLPNPGIEPCIGRWVLYHSCHLGSPMLSCTGFLVEHKLLGEACGTSFPDQGSYLGPPALGARSFSLWTTREIPRMFF